MLDISGRYKYWIGYYMVRKFELVRMCDVKNTEPPCIALRHDIDSIRPHVIMNMARAEEEVGVRSSWYIIVDPQYGYYDEYKELFLGLQERGHEIGLHVNSMEISHKPWKGRRYRDGVKQLVKDLKKIKDDGFDVRTATAHGIRWKPTNKDLLEELAEGSGVVPSTFYFRDVDYLLTDSKGILTIVDKLPMKRTCYCMLTHPEWYNENLDTLITEQRYQDEISPEKLSELV